MDRMAALSMIESGDDDLAIGKAGEISRYQLTKHTWRVTTALPLSSAVNPQLAYQVASCAILVRKNAFIASHHREPTDKEFYRLWNPHCPNETAQRFANLCDRK